MAECHLAKQNFSTLQSVLRIKVARYNDARKAEVRRTRVKVILITVFRPELHHTPAQIAKTVETNPPAAAALNAQVVVSVID